MHYLITGGCGFIGSHLVERLLDEGHKVTVIDNLSSGNHENVPKTAKIMVEDITTPNVFDAIILQVDGCFHLAGIASTQQSAKNWRLSHQVNVGGMVSLLDALVRQKRQIPVVFASSAAVYGNNPNALLREIEICRPISVYGADKLASEWHACIASDIYDIPTIGLRIFNVYGSRQNHSSPYSGIVSIFMDRMKRHMPITIFGNGEQSRDFIYVDDVISGFLAAMQKLENKTLRKGIFNLCTGNQTSVNELADTIAEITGSRSEIVRAASWVGDIHISGGDPTLGRELLGFQARTPLHDGLERLLRAL